MAATDPDELIRDIGRRVAELRADLGLTQAELAERAGDSIKYLQRIEGGLENLTIRSLVKLAGLLDVEVIDLFAPPESREVRRGRPPSSP